jgi:alpha-methylacyl-CoA racemase
MTRQPGGPLRGVKVVEVASIGPGPFCAMLLADLGAEVVRIERLGERPRAGSGTADVLQRGRRSIALDLKQPGADELVLKLVDRADALIEGFRPGVMERLGLGPDRCLARRPSLVYGRMTGWGQDGPLAAAAGHDINYIALSGALHAMGPADGPPQPPLNLLGDFGAGGLLLAFGLVCAVLEARASGQGQVVDAAMSDGSALLMSMLYGYLAMGRWQPERGRNFLDGSAHFYGCYECADGRWLAVGAIEDRFYRGFLKGCGLDCDAAFDDQWDTRRWPELRKRLAALFATRDRDAWCATLVPLDVCVSPVLDMTEAPVHTHHLARAAFVTVAGVAQPAPAPRFSRTRTVPPQPPALPGEHGDAILEELGFTTDERHALFGRGVVGRPIA